MSLTTSLVGGGPEGGATLGSLESGPLVGVLAAVVGVEAVEDVFAGVVAVMRALSSLFWLPTVIVLEPPDPQPAITAAAPSAARTGRPRRAVHGPSRCSAGRLATSGWPQPRESPEARPPARAGRVGR